MCPISWVNVPRDACPDGAAPGWRGRAPPMNERVKAVPLLKPTLIKTRYGGGGSRYLYCFARNSYISSAQRISHAGSHSGMPSHAALNPLRAALSGYRPRGPAMSQPCATSAAESSIEKSPSPKVVTADEPEARPLRSQCTRDVTVAPLSSGNTRNPQPAPLTPPA